MRLTDLSRSGFTLAELIIVTALMLLLALGISTALVRGSTVFGRLSSSEDIKQTALFLSQFETDLRNTARINSIPFEAEPERIKFASNYFKPDSPLIWDDRLAVITYTYDPIKKEVIRERKIPATFEKKESVTKKVILSGISAFSLSYKHRGLAIPSYVSVSVKFDGRFGKEKINREYALPTAYFPQNNF